FIASIALVELAVPGKFRAFETPVPVVSSLNRYLSLQAQKGHFPANFKGEQRHRQMKIVALSTTHAILRLFPLFPRFFRSNFGSFSCLQCQAFCATTTTWRSRCCCRRRASSAPTGSSSGAGASLPLQTPPRKH